MRAQHASGLPIAPSTLKNLGLAYVRLVRMQARLPEGARWPEPPGAEVAARAHDEDAFRIAAAHRVLGVWGEFLSTSEAERDPGRASIAQIVAVLRAVTQRVTAAAVGEGRADAARGR